MSGTVEVPRDPDAMIDKAVGNDYRPVGTCVPQNCMKCANKQAVPWFWCDVVMRQVRPDYSCDKWRGGAEGGID